jgi:hypothetical protein
MKTFSRNLYCATNIYTRDIVCKEVNKVLDATNIYFTCESDSRGGFRIVLKGYDERIDVYKLIEIMYVHGTKTGNDGYEWFNREYGIKRTADDIGQVGTPLKVTVYFNVKPNILYRNFKKDKETGFVYSSFSLNCPSDTPKKQIVNALNLEKHITIFPKNHPKRKKEKIVASIYFVLNGKKWEDIENILKIEYLKKDNKLVLRYNEDKGIDKNQFDYETFEDEKCQKESDDIRKLLCITPNQTIVYLSPSQKYMYKNFDYDKITGYYKATLNIKKKIAKV